MTPETADAIIDQIDSFWKMQLNEAAREVWHGYFVQQEVDEAGSALAYLARELRFPPRIADFRETIRMQRNIAEQLSGPVGDQRELPEQKLSMEPPEWVWVWGWARHWRDPQELRMLPQQETRDGDEVMTTAEYETLREEWLDAGSPRKPESLPGDYGRPPQHPKCPTCHDDLFVVVGTRPTQTTRWMSERGQEASGVIEEVAPCPDCNAEAYDTATFHRHDGSVARVPDPGKVREMMAR